MNTINKAVKIKDIPALEEAIRNATKDGVPDALLKEGAAFLSKHYMKEGKRRGVGQDIVEVQAGLKQAIRTKNISELQDFISIALASKMEILVGSCICTAFS